MNFYVKVSLNSCYNLWSSDFTDCLSTSHWPIIFILHAIFNPEQWHLSEFLITFDLFLPAHVCQFLESMELVGFFVTHYYTSLKLSLYHVSGVFFNVTYYYTSSKLTMYHYKWLRIMYFKHIKHVSSWRKHNVLFYSYAIILPRNLSLQKIMCILNTHTFTHWVTLVITHTCSSHINQPWQQIGMRVHVRKC